jgi:hypothetical protein
MGLLGASLFVCFFACSHPPVSGTATVLASPIPSASSSLSLGYDTWLTHSSQSCGAAESAATIYTTTNMGAAPLMTCFSTWDCQA